ncbi:hypothetical protein GCM10020331_023730 [Ectobacillus funiculus]
MAAITMIVGNTIALKQQNVKRLFAYSGIAHAGYLLVPLLMLSPFTLDSMWFLYACLPAHEYRCVCYHPWLAATKWQ